MKNSKKNKVFVKLSGAKQTKFFIHVAVVRNINNVAVNSLFYKGLRDFEKIKIS